MSIKILISIIWILTQDRSQSVERSELVVAEVGRERGRDATGGGRRARAPQTQFALRRAAKRVCVAVSDIRAYNQTII